MLELLTGSGLATAAGLNAALPLLILGILDRWTGLVDLPESWDWLSGGWVLAILVVLLVLDVVADKVPGVDHVNDVVQTVIRPTAGGLAFGAGSGAQTVAVQDPGTSFGSNVWVPVALGILLALTVHTGKALARPIVNATTLGVGGPVVSTVEDATALSLTFSAILLPVMVLLLLAGLVWLWIGVARRRTLPFGRQRAARGTPGPGAGPRSSAGGAP